MSKRKACCTFCGSEDVKKRFFGIPDVFGFGSGMVGFIMVIGGTVTALAATDGTASPESMTQLIVGSLIAVLGLAGPHCEEPHVQEVR